MNENYKYKISVITAVYNAEFCILNLIDSLRNQQDKDFEWVIVDGTSTDKTLEILKTIDDLNIKIISEPDFGIYDALNKGIKACSGEYYLVAGADDIFFENAILDFKSSIQAGVDFVTANIKIGDRILKPKKGPSWRYAQFSWVSGHAIGLLIKKDLHKKFGFYSKKFPIAADQLFIKNCCQNGSNVIYLEKIVGEFGLNGLSSVDVIGTCVESYRIQLMTERSKWVQTFIFMIRLLRRMKYI